MQGHCRCCHAVVAQFRACSRNRKPSDLDYVTHADDEQDNPELEAFDNIGTCQLEGILLLKALENTALDLDELVRHEEREECVRV